MKNKIFILLACLLAYFQSTAKVVGENDTTLLILKNAEILDVKQGKMIKGKEIVISNGRIIKIRSVRKSPIEAKVLDLKGRYIIPGLVDTHVHVTANRKNNIENTFSHLNYLLIHGITTVRDAGGDGAALRQAQIEIEQGKRIGSDVYFSSFMAGDWYYNRGQNIRKEPYTPWEQRLMPGDNLDSAMQVAKACGATGVKLYHSFDKDFLVDVAKAAKKQGLKVWGHTTLYPAKPIDAVKGGMEVLSHVYMLEAMRTEEKFYGRNIPNAFRDSVVAKIDITEFCKEMKAHNAILDATLCVSEERDPWVFPLLKRVHEQGVKISTGTDQIVDLKRENPRLMDEITYFTTKCGFTNAEAIRSATIIGAEAVGEQKNIGTVEKGKKADLLVLTENPLLDISALRRIDKVIKSGRVIGKL